MKVELSGLAESDLLDIGLYIAADNPDRAFSYVDELQEACWGLADRPLRFPILLGFEGQKIHRRVYGRHGIIYTVQEQRIFVLRILSTAMDIDRALGTDT
jgi:toxin ParE1/3/4